MKHLAVTILSILLWAMASLHAQENASAPPAELTISNYVTAAEIAVRTYDLEKLRPFKSPVDPTWKKNSTPLGYTYTLADDPTVWVGPSVEYSAQFPDQPIKEVYYAKGTSGKGSVRIGPAWTHYDNPVNGKFIPKQILVWGDLTPPETVTSPRMVSVDSEPQTLWLEFGETGELKLAVESTADVANQTITSLRYEKGLFTSKTIANYHACVEKKVTATWRRNPANPSSVAASIMTKVNIETTSLAKGLWDATTNMVTKQGPTQPLSKISFLPNGDVISISSNNHLGAHAWEWTFPDGAGIPVVVTPSNKIESSIAY